jgi:hypothetical protein
MTGHVHVALGLLTVASLTACSGRSAPMPGSAAPLARTIVLGATQIDPANLTMGHDETLSFVSTAQQPLIIEFIQPTDQTDRINCRVADPGLLEGGEAPWATFRTNDRGHLAANVTAGRFPSVCKLAPGSYTFVVYLLNPAMQDPGQLGREGTITVN